MKTLVALTTTLLVSGSAFATTVCGRIAGMPMIHIESRHGDFTLVSYNESLMQKLIDNVGAYACVSGQKNNDIYQGFDVMKVVSDEP